MLPSRGLARNPASALRYSLLNRTKTSRTASTRQFSQAQSQSSILSRRSLLGANTSHYGPGAVGVTAGVFAQRSGAARNLSFWPFSSSKSQTPSPAETSEAAPAAASTPAETASFSTPAEAAAETAAPLSTPTPAADEAGLNSTSDSLLGQLDSETLLRQLETETLLDIPARIGYLKELGLDFGWGTTSMCQWLLEHIHVYTGLPWWGSLTLFALVLRGAIFYPSLVGSQHQAKMQKIQATPAYINAKARFTEAVASNDRTALMYARAEMSRVMKKSGASLWRSSIQMLMIPFSIGMFRLLRGMSEIPVPGLENGGLAWFTDLTVRDPYFILPAASVGITFLIFKQTQRISRASPVYTETQEKFMKFAMTAMPPIMFITTMWFPAGLQYLLFCTSVGALAQTQATLTPKIREWMELPPIVDKPAGRDSSIIKGSAYEVKYESPKKTSFTESLKSGVEAATEALKSAAGQTPERQKHERAQTYEDRRAAEEAANAERRMDAIRRRRAQRKS